MIESMAASELLCHSRCQRCCTLRVGHGYYSGPPGPSGVTI
jgi:hypothetical protein